jgi:hypothetical protein
MLKELRDAHAQLLEALACHEAELDRATPDQAALFSARFRVSRTSLRRKMTVEAATSHCLETATPDQAALLDELRRGAIELTLKTSAHIGRWPMSATLADWARHRSECALLRAEMRRRIERERAVLYPMLDA